MPGVAAMLAFVVVAAVAATAFWLKRGALGTVDRPVGVDAAGSG